MLGHKIINKSERIQIIKSVFSDHNVLNSNGKQ